MTTLRERNIQELMDWLSQYCDVLLPVQLRFRGRPPQKIQGCLYKQKHHNDERTTFAIQLLDIPRTYIRRKAKKKPDWPTTFVAHRVCFQLQPSDNWIKELFPPTPILQPLWDSTLQSLWDYDWYVGAYYADNPTDMQPFGTNSILCPWRHELPIDHHSAPYRRVQVTVERL